MAQRSAALAAAQRRYNQKTKGEYKQVLLRYHRERDADVVEQLESVPNKREYVARLIRADRNRR